MGLAIDWLVVKCFGLILVPFIIGVIVRKVIDAIMRVNTDFAEMIGKGVQEGFRVLD